MKYKEPKNVLLTGAEFDELYEYSASNPTGVIEGKKWKRHDGAFDPRCHPSNYRWFLCEYHSPHMVNGVEYLKISMKPICCPERNIDHTGRIIKE